MESLEDIDPYTSYWLHWYPYEITRCPRLRGSVRKMESNASAAPRMGRKFMGKIEWVGPPWRDALRAEKRV